VNDVRWVNPHQPQTLYVAVMLCYLDAILGLLQGGFFLLLLVGLAAGGFGIANEKKWGYAVGVVAAVVQAALYVGAGLNDFWILINFLFAALLVVLLVHPMSRDYQRIWFK
jgi:hypothetical protein